MFDGLIDGLIDRLSVRLIDAPGSFVFLGSVVGSRGAVAYPSMASMRHLKSSSTVITFSGECGQIAKRRGYPSMASMRHLKSSATVITFSGECGQIAKRRGYPSMASMRHLKSRFWVSRA